MTTLDELESFCRHRGTLQADAKWTESLAPRKLEELEFHNRDRDTTVTLSADEQERYHDNRKFYATSEASERYLQDWLRINASGKILLDYACGNGNFALKALKHGARCVVGIDISDVSVRNSTARAADAGFSDRCVFLQADCEDTQLPAGSFDVIWCSGMLHHLDLSHAFPEIRRLLRPQGVVFCHEALKHNPVIQWYRDRTPEMRTAWEKEHILGLQDLRFASHFFDVRNVRYWHLLAPLASFFKRNRMMFAASLACFDLMDVLLTRVPLLQLMAWQFTFELHKKSEK